MPSQSRSELIKCQTQEGKKWASNSSFTFQYLEISSQPFCRQVPCPSLSRVTDCCLLCSSDIRAEMKLVNGGTTQQHIPVPGFWVFLVAKGVCLVWETPAHMWKSCVVKKKCPAYMLRQTNVICVCLLDLFQVNQNLNSIPGWAQQP